MDYKESKYTIDIAKDVMIAFKQWHKEKYAWYDKTIDSSSNIENTAIPTAISVVRVKNHKHVILGISYKTGRHNNKYYRMMQSSFHKWCNDKVIKSIERKYKVTAEFQNIGNSNPNPEFTEATAIIDSDATGIALTKSVVRWNDVKIL